VVTGPPSVTVDVARCIGAGNCVRVAPEAFAQRPEDGTAVVRLDAGDHWREDALRRAVAACPVGAIAVRTPRAAGGPPVSAPRARDRAGG
jgi:ferredoxin